MTDEFPTLLEFVRSDFKDGSCFNNREISPEEMIRMMNKHKLDTAAYALGKDCLPSELSDRLGRFYAASIHKFNKIQNLVFQLEHKAGEAGLAFVVTKGIGLNDCIYGENIIRSFGDLDILVQSEDAGEFHRLFGTLGFYQKFGPTSSAPSSNRYARAFTAVHAGNSDKTYRDLSFPVKTYQDKPEYLPYCRQDEPSIEMHDGLYYLSDLAVKKMLEETVRVKKEGSSYKTFDTEHTFILLLTNTYENSESFFSNTYDFGTVLRDYVDLRFIFAKYHSILDWRKIEKMINELEIHHIAEIVVGNLEKVYGKDVTLGCLPSVNPTESEWGTGILERMVDADLCRSSSLTVMRKRWLAEGTSAILPVSPVGNPMNLDDYHQCFSCGDALYHIEYTPDSFVLSWAIAPALQEKDASLLYQLRFFPLKEEFDYTSYKVDFSSYDGVYKACGHSTKRHTLGARRKEQRSSVFVSCFSCDDWLILQGILPFSELGIAGTPEKQSLCVSAEIYKYHYGEIYHKLNSHHSEPVMSLIKIK